MKDKLLKFEVSIIRTFLNIDEQNMEILFKGSEGTPVMIVSGMGSSFDEWYEITETLSKTNRVIMFHRPGLGESELLKELRNTETVINEISEIIRLLEIDEPFILVGHSYGGLCVQHFMKKHEEKVLGVVLVDSTSVNFKALDQLDLPVINEDSTDEAWLEKCLFYSSMNEERLQVQLKPTLTKQQLQFPIDIQKRLLEFQVKPNLYKAMYMEISHWERDAETIKNLNTSRNLPLIVIGRDKAHCISLAVEEGLPEKEAELLENKWEELIEGQAYITKNSRLIFAKGSSHSIHLDRPDIILEAIRILKGMELEEKNGHIK